MDQWSQVRIVKAVPITDLLEGRIKAQLAELHKSLITYTPITLSGVTSAGQSFDDASHALKTISTVTVCCDSSYLKSLLVAYRDGTQSDIHGGSGGTANVFELTTGEFSIYQRVYFYFNLHRALQVNISPNWLSGRMQSGYMLSNLSRT